MFMLTNEQRKCFALEPVGADWELRELKPSVYDLYSSYAYIKDNRIRKLIQIGEDTYREYTLCETISEDGEELLPKTAKGKPTKLTAAAVDKRTPVGMAISYNRGYIAVYNNTTQQTYYTSREDDELELYNIGDFALWVEKWCAEITEERLTEIQNFAARERVRIKYKEGDFFRYRINRNLWGYGRVLLNYYKLKNAAEIFLCKPVIISIYHIATEDKNVSIDFLQGLKTIPSQYIMDNKLFYGEFEIIGNKPILPEEEDFPIHYSGGGKNLSFQCGKFIKKLENTECIGWLHQYKGKGIYIGASTGFVFHNSGVGFYPNVCIPTLFECIKQNSNAPYWEQYYGNADRDLRNPEFAAERAAIFAQFGLKEEDFVKNS